MRLTFRGWESPLSALVGKTALITGAAKRIGRELAESLSAAGASVLIHHSRSREDAEALCQELTSRGSRAWTVQADFNKSDEVASLFERAEREAGPIDIVVNSASIFEKSLLADFTEDELFRGIRINAMAPLVLTRALAKRGRPGHVLNLLDTHVTGFDRTHAAYHLSKRMLLDLTRMTALEFGPLLQVNAIAPGLVLPPEGRDNAYMEKLAANTALKRVGNPRGVADAALYLLQSDYLTGQVIYYDGGEHLRGTRHD
jgi:NAD(P)-dependent dehydrogenase (short-subunit alcohol dehydrogenase family)